LQDERGATRAGQRYWLVLLLALALVRGLIYLAATPPWQAPDEWGHFEHAWLIAHLGRLPGREDVSPLFERELMASMYEWQYDRFFGGPLPEQMPARLHDLMRRQPRTVLTGRFSLAYAWTALFILPFKHQDLIAQLYAARFASVALNLGIVGLAWQIFRELLPKEPRLGAAMTAFIVLLPQHTFINASVNEGPLAELCACAALYGWLRLFSRGTDALAIIAIALGTVLGVWAKSTAFFLIPLGIVLLALFLGRNRRLGRAAWLKLASLALASFSQAALPRLQAPVGSRPIELLHRWWYQTRFEERSVSLGDTLVSTLDSFWAKFGWMAARAAPIWYFAVYVLLLVAVEGWIWPRTRRCSVPGWGKAALGAALLVAVATWLAFALGRTSSGAYAQGRYLFSVAAPVAFFVVGGWARWTPERWQPYFAAAAVTTMAVLDATAFCLTLWPFFYGWQ